MPTYNYVCTKCENIQEKMHSFSVNPEVLCELCNNICEKQFSPSTNFVLKGNNWPSKDFKMKKDMSNKNEKMKIKMNDREKSGEAVTTLGQIKNKKI
jgi:putative FmdB family regulatory protein